eukprot:262475-Chlamydomonas_euryale.AAC.2
MGHGSLAATSREGRPLGRASPIGRAGADVLVCVWGPAIPSEHPSERLVCWLIWRRPQATSPASVHLVTSLHRATGAAT